MTNQELVNFLDQTLFGMGYKDIERASIHGEAKLAGFILGACFIYAMAGFYAGIDKKESTRNSGERFKGFVAQYLPKYDAEKLWVDLRCGLVHSYAAGGSYVFTDANKAGFHFNTIASGQIVLNLEDFCADLREGYRQMRKDILTDDDIFQKAKKRFESIGLMSLIVA